MKTKEDILGRIPDVLVNFFYYDRKEDEELSVDELDAAIENRIVTDNDFINQFTVQLKKFFKENYRGYR